MPLETALNENESDSIALLKQRLSGFETEDSRLNGLGYVPGPRDVGITTTPKAGTTWMQQICHQLRTGGNMNFSEISHVVPWIELAHDQRQRLEDAQFGDERQELRFFKTHAWEEHCPPFARTIVVIRDPCDVLLSFYNFFEGWFFEPGSISLDTFADEFWLARGVPKSRMQNASYFVHLVSWYKKRKDPNVLFVCFEDLKDDLAREVKRIADFLSSLDSRYTEDSRIQAAISRSTYEFMSQHKDKFDEKLSKISRNEACGLPKDAGMSSTKIGRGLSGHARTEISPRLCQEIDKKWKEVVLPTTGCSSYHELRLHLVRERSH